MSRSITTAPRAALFVLLASLPLSASAGSPPTPLYSGTGPVAACYHRTNGQLRVVRSWLPAGCDPTQVTVARRYGSCQAGGAYECREGEAFLELGRGAQGSPGPKGDRGDVGPQGPAGPQGAAGGGGPVSGTRLEVLQGTYVGEDGSRLPNAGAQFFDRTLGVYCSPDRAADGELRCLPVNTEYAWVAPYFTDPGCTQRVAFYRLAGTTGCAPRFAYDPVTTSNVCDGGWMWFPASHYYQLGRALGPDQAFYTNASGSCTAAARPGDGSNELYEVGPEVPATAFVKISAQ